MIDIEVRSDPFPHAVLDGLWDDAILDGVVAEIPHSDGVGWRRYSNDHELKLEGRPAVWGPVTRHLFDAIADIAPELAAAFGTPTLHLEAIGGGYHVIPPGGFLDVHADFTRSPDTQRYRRLNVLVYLNRCWADVDGGELELWDGNGPAVSILPTFNRTVVFETSPTSFHGHPHPLPGPRWRRSFAAYFFSDDPPAGYDGDHSTRFHGGDR